jgi:CheY-like chemotaxis protein
MAHAKDLTHILPALLASTSEVAAMSAKFNFEVVPLAEVPWNGRISLSKRRGFVVLVVDDERIIADTLSLILSKSGYEVLTAYDGMGALKLAAEVVPNLLIADVVMPEMTGIELASILIRKHPECQVLLFSGQAANLDLPEKAGASGHDFRLLTKPVPPLDMLRHVSDCLEASTMMVGAVAKDSFHADIDSATSSP